MSVLAAVITSIQCPTSAMFSLGKRLELEKAKFIVVGDEKSPSGYDLPSTQFMSLNVQLSSSYSLAQKLPTGHYTRKNLGYLEAVKQGATCIYETDDDNAPLPTWKTRTEVVNAQTVNQSGWVNAYRYFSQERIWPRGFPLDLLTESFCQNVSTETQSQSWRSPIQQGLANGSPDVDAIWRLVLDQPFTFENKPSIYLPPGSWCPFNSQSTWWWPIAYPLMYLPSYCSFRMTDIWRSFIAQRCLWELDMGVVFHAPEVIQDRNEHNLMKDFEDEISGYLQNHKIINILKDLPLVSSDSAISDNLFCCYEALVNGKIFPKKELFLLESWLSEF